MAPVTECVCARVFIWWQECECQCMSNMFIVLQVVSHVTCHCFERKRKKSYANFSRWFNKVIYILISPKTESSFLFWFVVSTSKKWRLWLTCADCQLPSHRHQNSRRFWEWHHPPKRDLRYISSLFKSLQWFSSHCDCDDSRPLVCDLKDYISLLMGSTAQLTPQPFTFTCTKDEPACRHAVTSHFFLL